MAVNKNDKKIKELQAVIATKKAALDGNTRFIPVTNCLLRLPWMTNAANLNVLSKMELVYYASQLQTLQKTVEEFCPGEELHLDSWSIQTWLTDIRNRLFVLNRKNEEARLEALNKQLSSLLSNEAKVDDELAKILSSL